MQKGDIVLVNIPPVSEESGHEQIGERPALVVHNNESLSQLSVVMIIPITKTLAANRFPHTITIQPSLINGLDYPSVLLIFQLRAIDKTRIIRTIGTLEPKIMTQVRKIIKELLDIP